MPAKKSKIKRMTPQALTICEEAGFRRTWRDSGLTAVDTRVVTTGAATSKAVRIAI
jgi:hypothetical protein